MSDAPTIDEWSSQGMNEGQGQQFVQEIQHITPLNVFMRTLPKWCQDNDTGVMIKISSRPEWGSVGIEFGFDRPQLSVVAANDLTQRLIDSSRILELEFVIHKMKELGLDVDLINPLVDEVNELAEKLK